MGNAVKYSYEGGRVTVRVFEETGTIAIEVSDDGPGISEGDRERIFDDFFRSEAVRESGAGLGLAISHRIIEAHGGSISVESEAGKGSTFTIHLPVLDQSDQTQLAAAAETPPGQGGLR
jgi:signal transduction histidine kinase